MTLGSDDGAPPAPALASDPLDVYRRMFCNAEDGQSCWWYLGTSQVDLDGYPTIPVTQVEAMMIYRTRTLTPDAFRLDWWEIGCMRDPVTGNLAQDWLNPVTGRKVAAPSHFQEGPGHFIVQRDGDGLKLDLVQPHARVLGIEVAISKDDGRIFLQQTERKVRGGPLPDGSMPGPDAPGVGQTLTRLSIFADAADLGRPDAPASGVYDFSLAIPPWMGFGERPGRAAVKGVMMKAPVQKPLNPVAWSRLQTIFPDCFDGDLVRPQWGDAGIAAPER